MDSNKVLEDLLRILTHFKESAFAFLPQLFVAVFIFLIGLVVAHFIRVLVIRLVRQLPRLIPNQNISTRFKVYIEQKPIPKVLGGILYWIFILFFLTVATETLGLPVVTTWLSGLVGYMPKILSATLITIAGITGGVILRDFTTAAVSTAGMAYGIFLGKLVQFAVLLVTLLIGIDLIGIDITLLESLVMIVMGALFLGISLSFGLGAQSSVNNILASYYLQKLYKKGDRVRIENFEGRIIEITPLAVILEGSEGQICMPAHKFNQEHSILLSKDDSP